MVLGSLHRTCVGYIVRQCQGCCQTWACKGTASELQKCMLEVLTRQTGSQHLLAAKNQTEIAHDNAKCPHSCICTQVNNKLSNQKYSEDAALCEFKCNVSL